MFCDNPVRDYIYSRLFLPPLPLYSFPSCFDSDRDVFPQFCADAYFSHNIQSVCIESPNGRPTCSLVYVHGSGENLPRIVHFLRTLASRLDADVYAAEYPGKGVNPLKPPCRGVAAA